MATTEAELIGVDVKDRVLDAAKLRFEAASIEGGFKALAKRARELGEELDKAEKKAVDQASAGEQTMLFQDPDEAMLAGELESLGLLGIALRLAWMVVDADPVDAAKALKAARKACGGGQ